MKNQTRIPRKPMTVIGGKGRKIKNKIVVEPNVSPVSKTIREAVADTSTTENNNNLVTERVASYAERRKRASIFRRDSSRNARKRELTKHQMPNELQVKRRAAKLARSLYRRRVAGERGINYQILSPSDKIAVDRMLEPKLKQIAKLAIRLVPRVRKMAQDRLIGLSGPHVPHQPSMPSGAVLQLNHVEPEDELELSIAEFTEIFDDLYNKFNKSLDESIKKSLNNKSQKYNIPYPILEEVFNRGLNSFDPIHNPILNRDKHAFNRVNSFVSGGKARELDIDLWELVDK